MLISLCKWTLNFYFDCMWLLTTTLTTMSCLFIEIHNCVISIATCSYYLHAWCERRYFCQHLSARTQLPIRNWCNLVGIRSMVIARSGCKLVTFNLFSYVSSSCYTFQMALPSTFIFGMVTSSEYLGHRSVSRSWVQGQGSTKAVVCNSKTLPVGNCLGLIGTYDTIMLEVIWSFWHFSNWSSKFWMHEASSFIFSVKVHI